MILIHGVGLQGEAWLPMLPMLERHFGLIIIDLPGHGESSRFDTEPKLEDYTKAVAEVLDTQDAAVTIVGHSMGALIAMDLAIHFPDLVSGIAPLNAIFRRSETAKLAVQSRVAEINSRSVADPTKTLQRWFGDAPSGQELECKNACETWLTSVNPVGYAHAYSVFAKEDGPTETQLRSIACPSIFITGSEEPNSTPEMSHRLAELVPNGRSEIIPAARHMMPMTHPEAVSEIILGFFGVPGGARDN